MLASGNQKTIKDYLQNYEKIIFEPECCNYSNWQLTRMIKCYFLFLETNYSQNYSPSLTAAIAEQHMNYKTEISKCLYFLEIWK